MFRGSGFWDSKVQKWLIRWEAWKPGSQKAKNDDAFKPESLPACQPSSVLAVSYNL
jgi:hypothetical protein